MSAELVPGDIVHTKKIRVYFEHEDRHGWLDYSASKGHEFAVVLLGTEKTKDPETWINAREVMNKIGWEAKSK